MNFIVRTLCLLPLILTAELPAQPALPPVVTALLADRSGHDLLGRLSDDLGGRVTGSPANRAAMAALVAE